MAKLKDIFPRWLFKERGFGDLEVGGSFAHLVEDAPNSRLFADWQVVVQGGVDPNVYSFIGAGGGDIGAEDDTAGTWGYLKSTGEVVSHTPTAESPAHSAYITGDAVNRFEMHGDGSLHWGDGSAAPNAGLKRDVNDIALWSTPGRYIVFYEDEADSGNDIYFRVDTGVISVSANGGGLKLRSPDGSQEKAIRLSNAGTLELV